jgi:hypothetical protein
MKKVLVPVDIPVVNLAFVLVVADLLVLVLVCANLLVLVLLPDFSIDFLTTDAVVSSRSIATSTLSSTTPGFPVGGSPSTSNPIVNGLRLELIKIFLRRFYVELVL